MSLHFSPWLWFRHPERHLPTLRPACRHPEPHPPGVLPSPPDWLPGDGPARRPGRRAHTFNEAALRQTLQAIGQRSRATGEDIDRALEEGVPRVEEEHLRTFRDSLALEDSAADPRALGTLNWASSDRTMMEARLDAISVHNGDQHLQDLATGRPAGSQQEQA